MMHSFSYPAQLADLGISMAFSYTNMAMSGAFAFAAIACAAPFAVAAAAGPLREAIDLSTAPAAEATAEHYSAYRSDGGHATTLVIMGQLPSAQ